MCERAEPTRQLSELLTGGSLQGDPEAGPRQMLFLFVWFKTD